MLSIFRFGIRFFLVGNGASPHRCDGIDWVEGLVRNGASPHRCDGIDWVEGLCVVPKRGDGTEVLLSIDIDEAYIFFQFKKVVRFSLPSKILPSVVKL